MVGSEETAQDKNARERVEKCIEAMSTSSRHKGLALELLKLLGKRGDPGKPGADPAKAIDI